MEDKLYNIINTVSLIPVLKEAAPDVYPSVTYHFFSENGAVFAAGKATEEIASCQVDIWYQAKDEDTLNTIKEIKKAIVNEKTYSYPVRDYIYENENRIHHTYFTFEAMKESEE